LSTAEPLFSDTSRSAESATEHHRHLAEIHQTPALSLPGLPGLPVGISDDPHFTDQVNAEFFGDFLTEFGRLAFLSQKPLQRRAVWINDEIRMLFGNPRTHRVRAPFKPAASMRRAAWSPGGLRNTEPAFGNCQWLAGNTFLQQLT
jgi:hypothetical protein